MGISSNDIANVMGYSVDVEPAVSDTVEAWQIGIGYHFSTNTYTTLAPWYESYQAALDEHAVSSAQLHELQVKTVDTEGNDIKGLWIEVRKNNRGGDDGL